MLNKLVIWAANWLGVRPDELQAAGQGGLCDLAEYPTSDAAAGNAQPSLHFIELEEMPTEPDGKPVIHRQAVPVPVSKDVLARMPQTPGG